MAQFLEQIAHEQRYDERVKLAAIYARDNSIDNSTELVSSTITELLAHPPEVPASGAARDREKRI